MVHWTLEWLTCQQKLRQGGRQEKRWGISGGSLVTGAADLSAEAAARWQARKRWGISGG
ncbi:hypothetical protein [Ferviditalea candida]|uniref:Uncharacterized protein n=1 Tax=Ferviditalea candida TaxID=3108399 RepID=A0ABU5ZNG5_9BACL|nr:hypothetical protein [Paenibacillaceae bacterium T2]